MSYYPRTRPSAVTVAGQLLYAAAALYLVNVIIGLTTAAKSIRVAKQVLAETQPSRNPDALITASAYVGVAVNVVVLAAFILMAAYVLRGSNAWRITTFVVAGLALLCSFCGLAGSNISQLSSGSTLSAAQRDRLKHAVPTWARDGQFTASLLIAAALIAVIVLLARPASNAFFRRPEPT